MNEQTLIDMYRAGCVIEANEHLQYSPPADLCGNLPKVVMVGGMPLETTFSKNMVDALKVLQDEDNLGVLYWEQDAIEEDEEKLIAICPTGHEDFHKNLLTLADKYINLKDVQPEHEQLNRKNAKHHKPWYVGGRY